MTLNPYQGLKQAGQQIQREFDFVVLMTLNPYQGLKLGVNGYGRFVLQDVF